MKKETNENLENKNKKVHFKRGVSMITLIITIIVVIILAVIAIVGSNTTTKNATHAKYGHELAEIEEKVKEKRIMNAELGPGEEIKNTGFKKVVIEDAPDDFVSFDDDEVTGYWVNMDVIDEGAIKTGHEELTEMKVRFNYQDVYVYDAEGKVYYVRGWYDAENVVHYRFDSTESQTENKIKPEIESITYILSADKQSATVTIVANAKSEGTLEVTIDGKVATKVDENTYTITVTKNGTKNVLVKESTGGSASTSVTISGIEVEKDTTPPEITSLTSKVTGKTVLIEGSAKETECNIIGYKFTTSSTEPTDWISVNSITIQGSYTATTSGPYYLWVKNAEGLVSSQSINVTLPQVYTIKYNANGGSLDKVVASQEKIGNQNIILDNNSPTRTGHTFKGWGTSSNETIATYQPGNTYTGNASIELFAIWEVHKYTVTYNANGGSLDKVVASQVKTYGQDIKLDPNSPVREGYVFQGWGTLANSTVATCMPGVMYTANEDLNLFAIWKAKTYTITYNANGGSGAPASDTKTHGVDKKLSAVTPKKDGYTFQGWSTSSSSSEVAYRAGDTYTGNANIELHAIWKANTYTITYNANGGSGAPASDTKTHDVDKKISTTTPKKEGYTFEGWSTSSSSSEIAYEAGDTYTGNANIELHAVWKAKTYTITYDANGGSLDKVPSTQTKTHGVAATLNANSPVRDGYVFKGWGTTDSATIAIYQPGDTYSTDADLKIFAIWKEGNIVNVDGLGNVEVKDKNVELNYDPNSGELGGKVPPAGNTPETAPEIPKEKLPEIIEFGFGEFESKTTYTPGTYQTVPYETTYTATKLPVIYWNRIWSEWKITKDANGNVIKTEPGNMELADIDEKYSTYIVYDFETEEALEANGVKGDSVELWTIYNTTEDSLENAVYLAAYLNKQDGKASRHIAKWNGSHYVAYDADSDISAVSTFVEAYTVTGTKQVQVTAPSSSTEYVYIPTGTLKAEKGMTWAKWLASDYNTTGQTNPTIKTSNFVDVAYTDVIIAGQDYGVAVYKLSGIWEIRRTTGMVDAMFANVEDMTQNIKFTSNNTDFTKMQITADYQVTKSGNLYYANTAESVNAFWEDYGPPYNNIITVDQRGWTLDEYRTVDFGSTPQPVSKEFYEWFTANATECAESGYQLSGTWKFNDDVNITKQMNQNISFASDGKTYTSINTNINANNIKVINYGGSESEYASDGQLTVFMKNGNSCMWTPTTHKVIDLGSTPQTVSEEFYEWFTANAVEETKEIKTFTWGASNRTFQYEDGMTWKEWVNSEYNTSVIGCAVDDYVEIYGHEPALYTIEQCKEMGATYLEWDEICIASDGRLTMKGSFYYNAEGEVVAWGFYTNGINATDWVVLPTDSNYDYSLIQYHDTVIEEKCYEMIYG